MPQMGHIICPAHSGMQDEFKSATRPKSKIRSRSCQKASLASGELINSTKTAAAPPIITCCNYALFIFIYCILLSVSCGLAEWPKPLLIYR